MAYSMYGWERYKPRKKKRPKKYSMGGWSQVSGSGGRVNPRTGLWTPNRGGGGGGVVVDTGDDSGGGYHGPSDADLQAQAEAQAAAELARRRAAIDRIREAARAAAERDVGALKGLGEAQMTMLAPIPGQVAGIRNEAGSAIAGYGEGYSKGAEASIQQGQDTTAQTTAEQGQAAAPSVDPVAVQRSLYATEGALPATEQSEIGAASGSAAAGMPAVVARAAEEDIMQRMAEAAADDAGYRSQLLDLEAERPGLVTDALNRLYDIEEKKYGRWAAEQQRKLDERELRLRERAEAAAERQAGIKNSQTNRKLDLDERKLRLANAKAAADLQEQMAKGARPDASLSKVYGYVVDSNGNPILNANGQRIPVAKDDGKGGKGTKAQHYSDAVNEAAKMRGNPVKAPDLVKKPDGSLGSPAGQYQGRPGAKGLFPDGTTNDPNRAKRDNDWTFARALTYLMEKYGLTRAQARKALIAAGWKPGS